MRRSGAPSMRRSEAPTKSNADILALLGEPKNSFSSPIARNISQKAAFSPPVTKSNLTPKTNFAPLENISSPIERNRKTTFHSIPNKAIKSSTIKNNVENSETEVKDDFCYFTCVWCKKSGRKHKKWEGDGIVKIGARSVTVIGEDGKELARGSGFKTTDLESIEEGQLIPCGSKEIEITGTLTKQEWNEKISSGKENAKAEALEAERSKPATKGLKRKAEDEPEPEPSSSPQSLVLNSLLKHANKKQFQIPRRTDNDGSNDNFTAARTVAPGAPMYDVQREGALVLPRPPLGHLLYTERLVDVVVDPYIASKLRPHQRSGVIFMYRSLLGFETLSTDDGDFKITGCILADDMGLGKTLQTISVVWTLLKQSPVAGSSLARKVLIVAPASLLNNWEAEFKKWLGTTRIIIHVADNTKKVAAFKSYRSAPVLIVSYEMLVRAETELQEVKWNLIVCDEAHRLKNSEIKTSAALSRLDCDKKILLTGTPVQNDLQEYFCLMSVIAPRLLGSKASFTAEFVNKIERGREPGASLEVSEQAELALNKLSLISRKIVLRRTSDILSSHLPPKTTCVVFCRPSEFQASVYAQEVERLYSKVTTEPGTHLTAIGRLKKICNSPYLVEGLESSGNGANTWEEQSGKLSVLTCILLTLMQTTDEKIVLVSLSTATLDLLETLCSRYNLATLRLDGKTPPAVRQTLVNRFNKPDYPERVFLLSSKAGGTGLNLIGASRIVLYDIDWNPATDLQVMARIWRSGQKRHCYIYRLLTTGTIEEKIYQRQVMKSGLAGGIETGGWADVDKGAHFTADELKDIFTFRSDTESDTHELLGCQCGGSGHCEVQVDDSSRQPGRSCQLGTVKPAERCKSNMEKLMEWRHYTAPIYDKINDDCLGSAESFISFLFSHYQDSQTNSNNST